MKIKKGEKIRIFGDGRTEPRNFDAIALENFDTLKDEWWPVKVMEEVEGYNKIWHKGAKKECRRGIEEVGRFAGTLNIPH